MDKITKEDIEKFIEENKEILPVNLLLSRIVEPTKVDIKEEDLEQEYIIAEFTVEKYNTNFFQRIAYHKPISKL